LKAAEPVGPQIALAGTLGIHKSDNDEDSDCNIGLNFDWSQQSCKARIMQKKLCHVFCVFFNTAFSYFSDACFS
jgi:hypothetical protein